MAETRDFDPRTIVDDDLVLTRTADAMNASAFKHQSFLHRQRVGAARVRLARAIERGAPREEIEGLQSRLITREARLTQVETQFAAADIASPAPNAELAQVLGQVTGEAGEAPYTAALLTANGEILASVRIEDNGGFVLSVGGPIAGARLQVSDVVQAILFRDATGFDVALGQIATRTVGLEAPAKPATPAPTTLLTPDVVGQTEEAACAILIRLGVGDIDITRHPDSGPAGLVLAQSPAAGEVLVPDAGASLTVSERTAAPTPEPVTMPDFIGRPIEEARTEARALQIELAEVVRGGSAPEGQVITQSPAPGEALSPPFQATLVISEGRPDLETVEVPELVGRTADEATAAARDIGLTVDRRTVRQDGEAGLVVDQRPAAGTEVTLPATVSIVVNLVPLEEGREVVVPQLVDRSPEDAQRIGERAGFVVNRRNVRRDGPSDVVIEQDPAAGERVILPATIEIVVNTATVVVRRDGAEETFTRALIAAMGQDRQLSAIGLTPQSAETLVERLGLRSAADVTELMNLADAGLMERAELGSLDQAQGFRTILRTAMERVG
jgi:beta-lactam-binding protein with PASTA domain